MDNDSCFSSVGQRLVLPAAGWPFFQNAPDRAGAPTALDDAAKAIIDLRCRTGIRLGGDKDSSHLVITDDVAGADDHDRAEPLMSVRADRVVSCGLSGSFRTQSASLKNAA
jgi:hypothetical protein